MTTFEGGPAAGQVLYLRRSPALLRVTRDAYGVFDALDQLDDQAEPGENLFCYHLVERHNPVHLRMTPRGSGYFAVAVYHYVPEKDQPDDATMRSRNLWRLWTEENFQRFRRPL